MPQVAELSRRTCAQPTLYNHFRPLDLSIRRSFWKPAPADPVVPLCHNCALRAESAECALGNFEHGTDGIPRYLVDRWGGNVPMDKKFLRRSAQFARFACCPGQRKLVFGVTGAKKVRDSSAHVAALPEGSRLSA